MRTVVAAACRSFFDAVFGNHCRELSGMPFRGSRWHGDSCVYAGPIRICDLQGFARVLSIEQVMGFLEGVVVASGEATRCVAFNRRCA
ncbi:hypothetical protein [Xanthomonas vesicatoria]|uniref:Uncharacterized protein n=1 Tax=Xanthomonas vesicatoria TaxID=56460 RepID=A0ABS8L6C9_9XANT|nr:hypothetical protein [Xanthomonas vesicatoria]MCC8560154.1 hypothetical protein [Xanthomonas vesicatoria]MCC8597880.1 hypothetical protein [Xanthomonas vesicatoria]MCC8601084.1 hypothetical protein [Xanthomonas vesicatoria]MCC8604748.1 hypothetical protein [Xanthomonas vesicatoria]MCC8608303.1 hypothetical protein [Xanthomonas vesicatoria]